MKKIFTLMAGIMLTVAAMAADRYPSVTINSSRNFRIVVDGRSFFGNYSGIHLNNLGTGIHNIKVYEIRKGLFVKGEKMVTNTTFKLGRQDMLINVDNFGRVDISKQRTNDRFDRGRDWNDRDRKDDHDQYPSRRF